MQNLQAAFILSALMLSAACGGGGKKADEHDAEEHDEEQGDPLVTHVLQDGGALGGDAVQSHARK